MSSPIFSVKLPPFLFEKKHSIFSLPHPKGKHDQEIKERQRLISKQIGMDRMSWEGFKRQRAVGQLMFESLPQMILQSLAVWVLTIDQVSMGSNDDENGKISSVIDNNSLYFSICTSAFNVVFQMGRIVGESKAARETLLQYSLECVMARVNWWPFRR